MSTKSLSTIAVFSLLASALLPACADKDTAGKDTGSTDTDTDTDTDSADTDSADTDTSDTDTDTDTDTNDTAVPTTDITFDLEGSYTGMTISLTWLDATTIGTPTLTFGESFAHTGALADPQALGVATPAETAFVAYDEETAPGLQVAMYVPGMHADTDADGVMSGTEVWAGVGRTWVAYFRGTIPADFTTAGVVEGWNAVVVPFGGGVPLVSDIDAVPLTTNLLPKNVADVGGTYDGSDGRLALLPYALIDTGTAVTALLADQDLAATWTLTLETPPEGDHFVDYIGLGVGAYELPASYIDEDSSGDYTDGDTVEGYACSDGAVVMMGYIEPTGVLPSALSMTLRGQSPGWTGYLLSEDASPTIVGGEALTTLEISASCSL